MTKIQYRAKSRPSMKIKNLEHPALRKEMREATLLGAVGAFTRALLRAGIHNAFKR
jgi:hypothetical protein